MLDHDAGAAREKWYGAQEAARFLGVHRSTLHIAVRQGLIVPDSYTPGRHVRFKRETLEAFRVYLTEHAATSDTGPQVSLRALAQVAGLAVRSSEPEELASVAIAGIRSALPHVDMCCVAVRTGDPRDRYRMRLLGQQGFPDWVIDDYIRFRSTYRFATTAALRTLRPQVCEDTAKEHHHTGTEHLLRSLELGAFVVQPLVAGEEPLGVIICLCRCAHSFSDNERTFLGGIADLLTTALTSAGHLQQLTDTLTTSGVLVRHALRLHADASRHADDGTNEQTVMAALAAGHGLGDLFKRLSNAEEICALGFGRDLPTTNQQLLLLTCQACAGDDIAQAQWNANGVPYTGIGASVPLKSGLRGGVSAAWPGKRPFPEADHALLVTFAGAYAVAVDVR